MNIEEKEKFFLKQIEGKNVVLSGLFGNDRLVHLEIGSGRGEFLAEISLIEPEVNFLGLEVKGKRIHSILKKLDPERHSNIRLLRMMVDEETIQAFQPGSIERVYIFHPDPWPKRRHYKNRLIQEPFIRALGILLKTGGDVLITTDHQAYKEWIVKHFRGSLDFEPVYQDGFSREPFAGHIETHFEKKLKQKGFPPFYMKYIRK